MADYIEEYADMVNAPVRTGVEVLSAERVPGPCGLLRARHPSGVIESDADCVCHRRVSTSCDSPDCLRRKCDVHQMHSRPYRNPDQLADGAVMVVGAGSSGAQIADELNRAGRKVFPIRRPP